MILTHRQQLSSIHNLSIITILSLNPFPIGTPFNRQSADISLYFQGLTIYTKDPSGLLLTAFGQYISLLNKFAYT